MVAPLVRVIILSARRAALCWPRIQIGTKNEMSKILSRLIQGGLYCALALSVIGGEASGFRPAVVGLRGGVAGQDRGGNMALTEAFATWNLPWQWEWGQTWQLESRLSAAAGWIGGRGEDAFMASVGPNLALGWKGVPFSVEGGISPTVLSRHTFDRLNLGGEFQFTSYAGLNWHITPQVGLGYRFQHLSNAGLWRPNPGLNFHAVSLFWRF